MWNSYFNQFMRVFFLFQFKRFRGDTQNQLASGIEHGRRQYVRIMAKGREVDPQRKSRRRSFGTAGN